VRIVVEELSVKGFDVAFSKADGWASASAGMALEGDVVALTGRMRLERSPRTIGKGQGVVVQVDADARVRRPCDRCGRDTDVDVEAHERMVFVPTGMDVEGAPAAGERELDEDELDVGWFSDGVVLTEDLLSEALVLNAPPRVSCSDEADCAAFVAAELMRARPPVSVDGSGDLGADAKQNPALSDALAAAFAARGGSPDSSRKGPSGKRGGRA
jgi:uncharacterized metal-binding protein YceD (DUF177 family)